MFSLSSALPGLLHFNTKPCICLCSSTILDAQNCNVPMTLICLAVIYLFVVVLFVSSLIPYISNSQLLFILLINEHGFQVYRTGGSAYKTNLY